MLQEVGTILHDQNLTTNIHIIGGAAIALTLKHSRTTQDVDAIVDDHPREFLLAARAVAQKYHVDETWISDDVTSFVSREPVGNEVELVFPGLTVSVASPEHLLAMKTRAATVRAAGRDLSDLVFLARYLHLSTPEQVARLTDKQFQGMYRDSIGFDEYVAVAEHAFIVDELERRTNH